MNYIDLLEKTDSFKRRNDDSLKKIKKIKEAFKIIDDSKYSHISIYCGGSLGRGDVGKVSDLDLFIISERNKEDISRIETLNLLSVVIRINNSLGYPEFSNDGKYLDIYSFSDLRANVGSPKDDEKNSFTVRMLMLLESRPVFNDDLYKKYLDGFVKHYFRDDKPNQPFKPAFLMNDILRYWRTICLNYELIRNDNKRPWRKKNINLKFSRMLTAFGTILPLIAKNEITQEDVISILDKTPLERIAFGLDLLNDPTLEKDFQEFLEVYENFLDLKENMGSPGSPDEATADKKAKEWAGTFSTFLYKALMHDNIPFEYRKYLVL